MRSLRSRLIVGSILIAVIPLAIVTAVLSRQIGTQVRTRAGERLEAALGGLAARLETDGRRIDDQLDLLARDAALKRLYLLQPAGSRDLSDALAERRVLLGLDFLQVQDARGLVIGDASGGAVATVVDSRDSIFDSLHRLHPQPHGIGAVRSGTGRTFAIVTAVPIRYEGETVRRVRGGVQFSRAVLP